MARPHRFEGAEEYVQHLTWVTKDRADIFACPDRSSICLQAIDQERVRLRIEIYAYALMPDHFHIVIGPSRFGLGAVVQWMKLASTHWLKSADCVSSSPWERGYWDKAIRDARQFANVIGYLHGNPLKAGLVEDLDAYLFSSYRFYEYDEVGIISVTKPAIW